MVAGWYAREPPASTPFVDHPGFLVHKYSFFPVPSIRNRSAMKIGCQGVKREYPGTGNWWEWSFYATYVQEKRAWHRIFFVKIVFQDWRIVKNWFLLMEKKLVNIFWPASVYAPQRFGRIPAIRIPFGNVDRSTHFTLHLTGTIINQIHNLFCHWITFSWCPFSS